MADLTRSAPTADNPVETAMTDSTRPVCNCPRPAPATRRAMPRARRTSVSDDESPKPTNRPAESKQPRGPWPPRMSSAEDPPKSRIIRR